MEKRSKNIIQGGVIRVTDVLQPRTLESYEYYAWLLNKYWNETTMSGWFNIGSKYWREYNE